MRKEFTITEGSGEEVKLAVRPPQYEDHEEAEKVYALKVASLIRENVGRKLLSRQDLATYLRESGAWTEKDEQAVKKLQEDIADVLSKLRKGGLKLSEGRKLAIDAYKKRVEIMNIMSKRQMFDDTTIESLADNERLDYFVYTCTVYAESGENYWDSFEDMKNDKLSEPYQKASKFTVQILYNTDPQEFEKNLPENRWLKKYGLLDDEKGLIDRKTGQAVTEDGRPLEEVQAELKKRMEDLQGDIVEEAPFVDDETNEPIEVK